jgi:hypothetical protein
LPVKTAQAAWRRMGTSMEEKNEVEVFQCDRWDDFIQQVRLMKAVCKSLFRGHAIHNWKLESAWNREYNKLCFAEATMGLHPDPKFDSSDTDLPRLQASFLERFRDRVYGLPGYRHNPQMEERDWWARGRHHGLITPLLDWTESPYVAAFFGFSEFARSLVEGKDRLEYINAHDRLWEEGKYEKPVVVWEFLNAEQYISGTELKVFTSRIEDGHRQYAQQGWFTWLRNHYSDDDLERYLTGEGLAWLLKRYEIPSSEYRKALRDLGYMNINNATLFPDMDGVARHANIGNRYTELC